MAVEKRKAGRPKKKVVDPNAPKRPVGRPRKQPVDNKPITPQEVMQQALAKQRRPGVGRPRNRITVDEIIEKGQMAAEARRFGRSVEDLTPREKAAIIYGLVYNTEASQVLLWAIGRDSVSESEASRQTAASLWYNSGPVVIFRNQFLAQYEKSIQQKIDSALSVQKEQLIAKFGGIDPTDTDYTNPEAQKKLLNHLINSADDGKEKLDALKTIVSMQKDDREAAKDNKVQRFYMPLKCTQCPLHARAMKRRERTEREKAALEAAKKAAEELGVEYIEAQESDLLKDAEDDDSFLDETPGSLLPNEGDE